MVSRVLMVLLIFVYSASCHVKQVHKIGGLFNDENQVLAFKTAIDIVNRNNYSQLRFVPVPVIIPTYNALLAYNNACKLLSERIIGLFGPSSIHSSSYIQSLCDLKEIPHIETHLDLNSNPDNTLVNVYPHPSTLSRVVFDLVEEFDWRNLIILYDDDESLLSISSILELNSLGRTVVLRQLEIYDNNEIDGYRPMLTRVKLTRETKFVVSCSSNILERVLKELQEVGMMTDMYSYIIANLDMQTIELQPYQYAGTNITGIRMINPESQEVIATAGNIQKKKRNANLSEDVAVREACKMKLELALIVDAVKLFYETIHYLTADEKMYINATSIHCKSNDNWVGGNTIINLMKTRSVQGLTGLVKFDEGFRKDFIVDILELAPGGLLKVGDWNSSSRGINFQRPYKASLVDNTENSLFNRTLTVLITISPPYAMLKETTTQLFGNDRYEGFCIDVMEKLSKLLGFNYTFIVQEDKANGNLNKATNTWNGIIGEIVGKRADLGITDLTITSDRENAVDFTTPPFMNLGISILYRKPEPVPESLFMFARPFSLSVWTMLGVSYFLVSLAFFIMGRLSPTEWQNPYPCVEEPEHLRNQFSIRNSLWFTIGALMQQGTELAPVAVSTRTLSGIWWFFVLIMVSSYTANLAAFLTVETLVTPFKNINELAAQKEIKYGAKAGGATANYFRDSNLSTYKDIWSYMVRHPENMLTDNDEAVRKVETENYAFLMESTSIEYVIERHCSLAQVGGLLDDKGYGIAMAKDSPYRNKLSRELLKLQETGVLTSLKITWWKEKRGGGKCSRKPEGGAATPLHLQNVGGVFLVLFVGSILGLVGSFLELALRVYRRSKYKKLSFKEELKRELIFFTKFKQNVKEVSDSRTEDANDNKLIHKTRIEY